MQVAIITDSHWGFKKGSKVFEEYFENFYRTVFFPTLEEYGIDTVIHMGDAFDSRKTIDYASLEWAKRVVFDPLSKYKVHLMIGNHDTYYKNTSQVNSPELLLKSYPNIKTYSSPTEVTIGGLDILFLPWINENNETQSFKLIKNTTCEIAMGHLELNGFRVNKQIVMDHGHDSKLYSKFTKVFSGHYHTRSDDRRIFYLGNPYEMFWSDVGDRRGFTIFDTETLEHFPVDNPYSIFKLVDYVEDGMDKEQNFENKIVKVIVREKKNQNKFEEYIKHLYLQNPAEVKIVENFQIVEGEKITEDIQSENTLSILNRYVTESENELDKSILKNMIQEVYQESCEVF
ncbi:MAG: recombinase [Asgard group archaeon]|jgi:DNA repair exonuclease SbcCD nuclease subunit|nr:recombinase [Asgard group archaeon]